MLVKEGNKVPFTGYLISPDEMEIATISMNFLKGSGILDEIKKSNSIRSRKEGDVNAH